MTARAPHFFRSVMSFVAVVFPACAMMVPVTSNAHGLTITLVVASFERPGELDVAIDYDFSAMLGSSEAYHRLATSDRATQQATIDRLLPKLLHSLQIHVGRPQLELRLRDFSLPQLTEGEFADPSSDKFTTLLLVGKLPATRDPLVLAVPYGSMVDYPVGFTVQIPHAGISTTSWMEDGTEESEPFAWADLAPRSAATGVDAARTNGLSATSPTTVPPAAPTDAATPRPPMKAWYQDVWGYLRLGFHHIVPEGTDHILFVLGLFFLGITWRKLIAQTSVFTVAHATTLFLSSYGIFRLPGSIVEPLIALSISFIALQDIFRPKLGSGRLIVVFCFGLIHGLGFASSLSEVPFPKHDFLIALLGFNFGVDFGQLFIIALAFLAVGWFRERPWFHRRIATPCCLIIAGIGLFWTVQRVMFYGTHGR